MALDQETKDFILQEINARLTKVRIPELPENTDPLAGEDQLPIYIKAANKTRWESLADLATFFAVGGDGTTTAPDSAAKGEITDDITAAQAGSNTLNLPAYAGKQFTLSIDGRVYKDDEFDVLNAGGFKVNLPGFTLQEGMRYTLRFAEPIADGATPTGSGGFIRGTVVVNTSTTLSADDMRKLIQVRGGTSSINITLPDVAALPENDFLFIECHISNTKQQKISTQGGQFIYLNSTSKTALYLAPGEVLALYRKSDGWYPLDQFGKNYEEIGHPIARYKVGTNELLLKGQQVAKADYPRLYEQAQTFGGGFISKATYDSNPTKYRGCYVDVNTTIFQLPNLMNVALRGLESESGTDTNRDYNAPGGYQADSVGAHDHDIKYALNGTDGTANGQLLLPDSGIAPEGLPTGTNTTAIQNNSGEETVMKNVGIYWVTKI